MEKENERAKKNGKIAEKENADMLKWPRPWRCDRAKIERVPIRQSKGDAGVNQSSTAIFPSQAKEWGPGRKKGGLRATAIAGPPVVVLVVVAV